MSNLPLPPGFSEYAHAPAPEPDLIPEPESKIESSYKGLCVGSARFCTEVAPLLNMQMSEAPADVGGEDWLYLYNYQGSSKPVPVILKYLWEPWVDAVKMALDPRFTMSLSAEDIQEIQKHKDSKVWLLFWLEWGKSETSGVQFGVWYTTVSDFNKFLELRQTRTYFNRWLFDVRNFKQFRWHLDTRGTYFAQKPYQEQQPENMFPTRESIYEGVKNIDENQKFDQS